MKHRLLPTLASMLGFALLGPVACGVGDAEVEQDRGSLRAALTRPTDELELEDLRSRAEVAERLLAAARSQLEAGELEQVTRAEEGTAVDAVARADGERAERQLDPLIVATLRAEERVVTVVATGRADLLSVAALTHGTPVTSVRVGEGFADRPSEALRGMSEAEAAEQLGALIAEIGAELTPPRDGWTLIRRAGLLAGFVFLPEEGIVELNPALLYYLAALDRPGFVTAQAPASVTDPDHKPSSSDWEIFTRWLENADPSDWTNLAEPTSQTDPNDPTPVPTPTPVGCPCCFCSVSGLGATGEGLVGLTLIVLPVGLLLVLRRRR